MSITHHKSTRLWELISNWGGNWKRKGSLHTHQANPTPVAFKPLLEHKRRERDGGEWHARSQTAWGRKLRGLELGKTYQSCVYEMREKRGRTWRAWIFEAPLDAHARGSREEEDEL